MSKRFFVPEALLSFSSAFLPKVYGALNNACAAIKSTANKLLRYLTSQNSHKTPEWRA